MNDFSGCNINIYDDHGTYLGNVRIDSFDKMSKTIEVSELPDHISGSCEVVILSAPIPFAYKGNVRRVGGAKYIALYEGHTTEQRKTTRYKTNLPGVIEHLVYNDIKYRLLTPMVLQIVNISKRGLRLRGRTNDLVKGLRPRIRINVGKGDQILTADVVNVRHRKNDIEEYGCSLYNPKLIGDNDVNSAASAPGDGGGTHE